jgi:hypothetical protein
MLSKVVKSSNRMSVPALISLIASLAATGCGATTDGAGSDSLALRANAKDGVYRIANCLRNTDDQENRATLDVVIKEGRAVALQGKMTLASPHESGTVLVRLDVSKVSLDNRSRVLFRGANGTASVTVDSEGGGREIARFTEVILGADSIGFDVGPVFAPVNPGCKVANEALLRSLTK